MLRQLRLPTQGSLILILGLITAAPAAAQGITIATTIDQATRDVSHTWSLSKTGSAVSGLAGETLPGGTWTINVSETTGGFSFISGFTMVTNHTTEELALGATALMDDGSGLTVVCPPTIRAEREVPCFFNGSVGPTGLVLTVTVNAGAHTATELINVNFVVTNAGGSAVLTDTVLGVVVLNQALTAGQGPWTFSVKDEAFLCPSNGRGQYPNYVLEANRNNNAFLEISGGTKEVASATITYTCRAGFLDIIKKTNGVADPSYAWVFPIFSGPDGYTPNWANLIGGVQSDVDPDADGLLPAPTLLNPTQTYTICEVNLPAGWSAPWTLNGQAVVPYDPDADSNPPEDLGNRCLDIGAGTPYPIAEGTTVTIAIDNRPPDTGGQPRTPGYWKNWNRCTNGGQARNADRQALAHGFAAGEGWRAGYWLLDNVLDPAVGGGITWDDILVDALVVAIESCEEAVEILDSRVVSVNGNVGDGKKLSSDAARVLARSLLAAQANFAAGACTTPAALTAAAAAEALLDGINFDGTSTSIYLKSGALAQQALALHGILDAYNNGAFCGNGQ
jgi:hypothetical protein